MSFFKCMSLKWCNKFLQFGLTCGNSLRRLLIYITQILRVLVSGTDYVLQLVQEVVPLRKVCRRPETEQRLQLARDGNAVNSKMSNVESLRALGGTPSIPTASQIPPTTPATPAQPSSAFNATLNPYTGTPNLYTPVQQASGPQSMQPIPMQSMSPGTKPDTKPSAAPTYLTTNVLGQGAAVSSSQGPAASMQIATQQVTTSASAQQSLPSIESSIIRQLNISTPHQQAPLSGAGVQPKMSGTAQQEPTSSIPVVKPSGVPEQPTVASTGVAEPAA